MSGRAESSPAVERFVVGLTGGIGSGKSLVTDHLLASGYRVLDADEISRRLTAPGSDGVGDSGGEILSALKKGFGESILTADGELDRKALAALVFSDSDKVSLLNSIMHGAILAEIRENLGQAAGLVFLSAPLLVEAGLDTDCDQVWLITASDEIRAERAAIRDGCTREDVMLRMKNQMPEDEKRRMADVVFLNEGTPRELLKSVDMAVDRVIRAKKIR
ncbi:MAG: dephospho-CoA kinase [Clostridiales Family XIII bacterium]|jgi:dephospho-CoA kinase|nr:dephospho-CoA kinase [Clostridiales Family XIII bacterium]